MSYYLIQTTNGIDGTIVCEAGRTLAQAKKTKNAASKGYFGKALNIEPVSHGYDGVRCPASGVNVRRSSGLSYGIWLTSK